MYRGIQRMNYPIVNLPRPYPIEYGFALYDYVLKHKPKKIVEFGSSWGFTTIYMAKALQVIGEGEIWTCDNENSRVSQAKYNFNYYDVSDFIDIELVDFKKWFDEPYEFDLCYIDIHNDGKKLQDIFDNNFFKSQIENGKKVLFEGGSSRRSEVAVERGMKSFDLISYRYSLMFGNDNDRYVIGELK